MFGPAYIEQPNNISPVLPISEPVSGSSIQSSQNITKTGDLALVSFEDKMSALFAGSTDDKAPLSVATVYKDYIAFEQGVVTPENAEQTTLFNSVVSIRYPAVPDKSPTMESYKFSSHLVYGVFIWNEDNVSIVLPEHVIGTPGYENNSLFYIDMGNNGFFAVNKNQLKKLSLPDDVPPLQDHGAIVLNINPKLFPQVAKLVDDGVITPFTLSDKDFDTKDPLYMYRADLGKSIPVINSEKIGGSEGALRYQLESGGTGCAGFSGSPVFTSEGKLVGFQSSSELNMQTGSLEYDHSNPGGFDMCTSGFAWAKLVTPTSYHP